MTDWRRACRAEQDLLVEGDAVIVELGDARRQRVTVTDTQDTFELTSVVVRARVVEELTDVTTRAWRRNRSSQLVGFRVDAKGRLVAEAWIPKAGVTPQGFLMYLRRVAAEADLFEHQLTGKDRE